MIDAPLIHHFEEPLPLDGAAARRWLGGKGASVAQMTSMGLPVPPGFTISTDAWRRFDADGAPPEGLLESLGEHVARIEEATGRRFGDASRPLLLAVRSGGPTSMPGMLDTVLDVGVNRAISDGLRTFYGDPRFAVDVWRRFLESFASVVLGVPQAAFDALLGGRSAEELGLEELEELTTEIDKCVQHESGARVPDDPHAQLRDAVVGVMRSWRSERAVKFRDAHGIADTEGTGVTVQAMVFGNLPDRSGAGVVFSRNPATGERTVYGEWLARVQGEDIVSGRRTPNPLMRAQVRRGMEDASLESALPEIAQALTSICDDLERRFGDAQDVEFTVERGRLYVLQCRPAPRSPRAALRIAAEMVREGSVTRSAALRRLDPASLRQLLTPRLPDPETLAAEGLLPFVRGLAASPGAATGRIVLDTEAAEAARGTELILARAETSAEDVAAMRQVAGILTAAGGLTSHAAVVARAMGKPCVAGATSLHVDYVNRRILTRDGLGQSFGEGDLITIDGARGLVYEGAVAVEPAPQSADVLEVLGWAREACRATVVAIASGPSQITVGLRFGADGALVRGADPNAVPALLAAVGEGPLFLVATDETSGRALAAELRPIDSLLLPRAPAHPIEGPSLWIESSGGGWRRPDGAGVILEADEPSRRRLAAIGEGGVEELVVAVPPLDVPVARLLAAQLDAS